VGAATPFIPGPDGTPIDVTEKLRSWWRANGRNIAELGKHSSLLADGMIDASGEIYVRSVDGKPTLFSSAEPDSILVKAEGQILTLTAQEAVQCGLAKQITGTVDDLGAVLGFKGWTKCEGIGEELVGSWEKRIEGKRAEFKSSLKRYRDAIEKAGAIDPASFEYAGRYEDDVKVWNNRSTLCAASLERASASLYQIQRVVQENPWLEKETEISTESIAERRREVEAWQARLAAGRLAVPFTPTPQGERGPSRTVGRLGRINN
jgi:hypothetical protein